MKSGLSAAVLGVETGEDGGRVPAVNFATFSRPTCTFLPLLDFLLMVCSVLSTLPPAGTLGVGHPVSAPVQSLSDMWRSNNNIFLTTSMVKGDFLARARSAQIGGPKGISQFFHVRSYSSEPVAAIR